MKKGLLLLGPVELTWKNTPPHRGRTSSHWADPPRELLVAIGALLDASAQQDRQGLCRIQGSSPPSRVLGVFKPCSWVCVSWLWGAQLQPGGDLVGSEPGGRRAGWGSSQGHGLLACSWSDVPTW